MPFSCPSAGRTRTLATGLVVAALAVGVSGCSTAQKAQSAAVIDGEAITNDEVVSTTQQFNDHLAPLISSGQRLGEETIVSQLVVAHFVNGWLAAHGGFKGDTQYAAALAAVPDPSSGTKAFLQSFYALQSNSIPQEGVAQILASAKKAKVEVNPRYGSFDASQVKISAATPNWIKPGSANPATTAPAAAQQ